MKHDGFFKYVAATIIVGVFLAFLIASQATAEARINAAELLLSH